MERLFEPIKIFLNLLSDCPNFEIHYLKYLNQKQKLIVDLN